MPYFTGLSCRECGRSVQISPVFVCEHCFGPLEVVYDYESIQRDLSREDLQGRPFTMWRYQEFLPVNGASAVGESTGGTPLVHARRLGEKWGLRQLYIKNDSVNAPTLSFKDRVVAVALRAAIGFGFDTIGCASTGNLANSVAAQSAAAGLPSFVFIPHDLEASKINATLPYAPTLIRLQGNYDEVNRLCSEVAFDREWGFVNINLRPFYAEGSKTMGFEIAEQLGWRLPDAVVIPMAGGSLVNKIPKAFNEFVKTGFCGERPVRIFGAQASGCNPITDAVKQGREDIVPQRPNTIARSLAIGNPADGFYAVRTMRESGGWGEDASDEEIVQGIELLAQTEGIFTETAGGVTVAAAKKLIDQGRIKADDLTVLCITGNGLKTQEVMPGPENPLPIIAPKLEAFNQLLNGAAPR